MESSNPMPAVFISLSFVLTNDERNPTNHIDNDNNQATETSNNYNERNVMQWWWSIRSLSWALAMVAMVTFLCIGHTRSSGKIWIPSLLSLDTIRPSTTTIRGSSSESRSGNRITSVKDDQNLDGKTSRKHVAILIAGQCHRFAYREQEGPLLLPPKNSSLTWDVYIVLQCGTPQKTFTGHVETPPYMEPLVNHPDSNSDAFVQEVTDWYRSKGARNVQVQILDEYAVAFREAEITKYVTKYHGNNGNDNQNMIDFLQEGNRWSIEARKFYLRHAVYQMALRQQEHDNNSKYYYDYDAFVFWREDNYFLRPLDMEHMWPHLRSSTESTTRDDTTNYVPPRVVTDSSCTFGAYSDKMYIANRVGADLLFQPHFALFLESMKRYVLFANYRKQTATTSSQSQNHHPFKPEMYVHDVLMAAQVAPVDLGRVDVRYNDGQRCVPNIYHRCLPEETQSIVREHKLAVCQDNGLHWRRKKT